MHACLLLPFLSFPAGSISAEEELLWTQKPVRIDRSRQTYERLPARPVEIDQRVWLKVAPMITVHDAGSFTFGGRLYRIEAVTPVARQRVCRAGDGSRWSCGRMAAIFLGNLVRNKRMLCDAIISRPKVNLLRGCRIGNRDIAHEIVANGHGYSGAPALAESLRATQLRKAGIWKNPACLDSFHRC